MYKPEELRAFYRGKKVLVTGHTGFKGQWITMMLSSFGAIVIGFSNSKPSLNFKLLDSLYVQSIIGDVRDYTKLNEVINVNSPDLIIHLAAETLVIESYLNPLLTWQTNVLGTVNLLESVRLANAQNLLGILIVTTDKVYKNTESPNGYIESDHLGGVDPYSASKSAVELLVESWRKSFINETKSYGIATARAGNVIGGGDWNQNRLIPDFYRAARSDLVFQLRNPESIRPWQHVLDVSYGYLSLLYKLSVTKHEYCSAFNFGPIKDSQISCIELIEQLNSELPKVKVTVPKESIKLLETKVLKLNSEKAIKLLDWEPVLSFEKSIDYVKQIYSKLGVSDYTDAVNNQLEEYLTILESKDS